MSLECILDRLGLVYDSLGINLGAQIVQESIWNDVELHGPRGDRSEGPIWTSRGNLDFQVDRDARHPAQTFILYIYIYIYIYVYIYIYIWDPIYIY